VLRDGATVGIYRASSNDCRRGHGTDASTKTNER
jgi:hypothetical protein